MFIALAALVLALVALGKVRAQAGRTQRALTILQEEGQLSSGALNKRLEELEASVAAGEKSPAGQDFRQLASTVKVLELRALEHDALLCSLVTEDEARHLWNASKDGSTTYERHHGVEHELRSLVRRGLLKKRAAFKIHELPDKFDILDYFELSEAGEMLLALRKHLKASDTRRADSLPPRDLESGVLHAPASADAPEPRVRSTG